MSARYIIAVTLTAVDETATEAEGFDPRNPPSYLTQLLEEDTVVWMNLERALRMYKTLTGITESVCDPGEHEIS